MKNLIFISSLLFSSFITLSQTKQSSPIETMEKAVNVSIEDTNFFETPITLQTSSGQIFGTLTTPKIKSRTPLALIIAGSGPTDRNCNNPMAKCDAYRKLAHGLVSQNIASLRYDKRGIAESQPAGSSEADLRFENYINDAKEWIQLLKQDQRFSEIDVIGHSEGSLIGMMAASAASKFISIAGPGRSADKLLKEQLSSQPIDIKDACFPMIDSLANGKKLDNLNPMFYSLFRPSVQPYMISWFKYDPQTEIQKLTIPILIIQGTKDIQVSIEDAKLLSKANLKAQLILIDKMNHIFRTVDGDTQANIATYNNTSLPLTDELAKSIVNFIRKK